MARLITRRLLSIITLLRLCEPDNVVPNYELPSINTNLNASLIEGVYDYHSNENFDAYLEELGVSWYLRELAAMAAPTVSISRKYENCLRYDKPIINCNLLMWLLLIFYAGISF